MKKAILLAGGAGTSFSAHQDRLQTASSDLRQANDLLPAGHAYARRATGSADHYDA